MKHWERVRHVVKCTYGCEIRHPDWAYIQGRFAVCEPCAAKMNIRRLVFGLKKDEPSEPHNLVPASPVKRGFTAVGAFAESLQDAPTVTAFLNQMRRLVGRK